MQFDNLKHRQSIKQPDLFSITYEAAIRAMDGADARVPLWSARCYEMLRKYIVTVPDFITEDFREWCRVQDFPMPDEQRAFGGVIMRASRDKLIVPTGEFRKMKDARSHQNPKQVWRQRR